MTHISLQFYCVHLLKGLGYGMITVSSIVMLYYNMIIAWTLFYMAASMTEILPWSTCDPSWSTPSCFSYQDADECATTNGTYYNRTCFDANSSLALNLSALIKHVHKKTPADEYFTWAVQIRALCLIHALILYYTICTQYGDCINTQLSLLFNVAYMLFDYES